jgi:tetratricopeptide (TPR) repeat protein
LKSLGQAGSELRQKLGESISSVQKFNKPLSQVTTSSLEALEAYSQAIRVQYSSDSDASFPYLTRAVQLDPNFARAYASIGTYYSTHNQATLAIANYKKAFDLRNLVTDRERFYIEGTYYMTVTGQIDKAEDAYKQWSQAYPNDDIPLGNLGVIYSTVGRFPESLAETRAAMAIVPNSVITYGNMVGTYLSLNRVDEATAMYKESVQRNLDGPYLRLASYCLAFRKQDAAGMAEAVSWANGKSGVEDTFLSLEADTETFHGRLAKARTLATNAADSAKRAQTPEAGAIWLVYQALRESEMGDAASTRKFATAAIALAPGRDVELLSAIAYARSGDAASAQKLIDRLSRDSPTDTMMQGFWLPSARAALELSHGTPARALEVLEPAAPYDLAAPGQFQLSTVFPLFFRGQAYLKMGNAAQAISQFQKIIDNPGAVLNFYTFPLAHLGLARAYAASGDTAKARAAYSTFLNLWKDADPNLPLLLQAKSESVKLQ